MDAEPSQPTQPATQQVLDPRRLGRNNSGLNDNDIADVLIVLHPASATAIRIVEDAAHFRPEHVLFRDSYGSIGDSMTNIEEQETIIVNAAGERLGQPSRAGGDLALRMSSARILKQKQLGFIFGRNQQSSDIIFGQDTGKRISNQHFRIFLNPNGVLMLEDLSTNGTIVDDSLLKSKDPRFDTRRMLTSGSIIMIQNSNDAEMIKFIVRIPSRTDYMEMFNQNLRQFILECTQDLGEEQEKAIKRITRQHGGPTMKWNGGERYNIIGQVGKGAFATVYQLATKMEGKLLAAKELEKRRFMKNGMLDRKIDNEMKIMQSLRHENIVEFVEYHDQGDYLYIIMEYVRQGDLQGYLQQGSMQEEIARTMAQQILSALLYLHRQKITHRDIKPDNILIADLNPFTVKLSDFGLSKVVKHEETFLKTFCGTLLYCAPEVFPDYGHAPQHGTKRRRGAKTYHSYSSSVDIWSFGGVLWYALCGEPPFKGIADATGEAMFNNIMATPLDPTPLHNAGVSNLCIDLLMRMLKTDPAERPTDLECLNHPWLSDGRGVPNDPILQSIVEEDESEEAEQQLSQLSIEGGGFEEDEGEGILSDEELMNFIEPREPKRVRTDPLYPRNQHRDQAESSVEPSFQSSHLVNENESFQVMPTPRQPRLFGEIGQSALTSSAVFNARANSALAQEDGTRTAQFTPSVNDSYTLVGAQQHGASTAPPQTDNAFSSPSLLGAESMVRELVMTEPRSPGSRTQSPFMPATPKTPEFFQQGSLDRSSKQPSQISEPTPKARTSGINRQISLRVTASYFYDPMDPSTHTPEYASRISGYNFTADGELAPAATDSETSYATTAQVSDAGIRQDGLPAYEASQHSAVSNSVEASSRSAQLESALAEPDSKPPPRRLGKLSSTSDSFHTDLVLNLEQSKTSWGRHWQNTIVYDDPKDTRVPKTAFVIFWYSSSEQNVEEFSQHDRDWTVLEDLHVGIWTCATRGIFVNGKHLRQKDETGRVEYGHLHTGDVIQVYQNPRSTQCLRFECEFYFGSGKDPRRADQSFETRLGGQLVKS